MSNQLLSTQREGPRLLDQSRAGGGVRPPRISIDNGRFRMLIPGGQTIAGPSDSNGPYIDIVVIGTNPHPSKLYWGPPGPNGQRIYERSNPKPPVCFSDNGKAPSASAPEPQSPTCADCPHNVWGTAINTLGHKVKACEDFKKFAVLVQGTAGVYLFEIKPGSFKSWSQYLGMLSMQKIDGGVPDLCDVITRVRFTGTGVLGFEPIAFTTSDAELVQRFHTITPEITRVIVGANDVPATNVLPISEQHAARDRGMPPQAPMPPPQPVNEAQAQTPFVLSGQHLAGTLFPQQPSQAWKDAATTQAETMKDVPEQPKTRGRPKKQAEPQAQPAPPQPPAQAMQGPLTPAGSMPMDISSRLQSIFPKA